MARTTTTLEDHFKGFETSFAKSELADLYAIFHKKLNEFERAPSWKRILMGGYFRKKYLKMMLDLLLEEYLWETDGW